MATTHPLLHPVLNIGLFNKLNRLLERVAAVAVLPGRALLSTIFLWAAFGKITDWSSSAGYMTAHGMPLVPFFLAGAIFIELGGGLALLLGWNARLAALVMALYLVPVTLIFHNFWAFTGQEHMVNFIMFLKNLSIMGGLLMVFGLGGGGFSLDARAEHKAAP